MAKVDTVALVKIINDCFDFSIDGRFTDEQQEAFLEKGQHLRGNLVVLLAKQFDEGTEALTDANAKLHKVNAELSDQAAVLSKTTETLNNLAKLAASLDMLLNVALPLF